MNNNQLFAVYQVLDDSKELCTTYNPTHNVWMPSIFFNREDADSFYKEISSVKGYEGFAYVVEKML